MDTHRPSLDAIWRRYDDFELPEIPADLCPYARAFSDWAAQVLDIGQDPTIYAVTKAKLLLLDKYFEWWVYAPRQHRYHLSPQGHTCIFQVFIQSYRQMKALELSLTPLLLIEPVPPPPPPRIAGIPFAEILGEE